MSYINSIVALAIKLADIPVVYRVSTHGDVLERVGNSVITMALETYLKLFYNIKNYRVVVCYLVSIVYNIIVKDVIYMILYDNLYDMILTD